jgi:hypothetical protein
MAPKTNFANAWKNLLASPVLPMTLLADVRAPSTVASTRSTRAKPATAASAISAAHWVERSEQAQGSIASWY